MVISELWNFSKRFAKLEIKYESKNFYKVDNEVQPLFLEYGG